MGCCATCRFDPCRCSSCGSFTDPFSVAGGTLIDALQPCVDQIRDIYTCLGTRVYTVALVRTRWSGGARGCGVEEVIEETMVQPTPLVEEFVSLDDAPLPIGSEEAGVVRVSEISIRFTEDQLRGLGPGGESVPGDEQFYWEITMRAGGGGQFVRRRFTLAGVPEKQPTDLQWVVLLKKQYEDRTRDGVARG